MNREGRNDQNNSSKEPRRSFIRRYLPARLAGQAMVEVVFDQQIREIAAETEQLQVQQEQQQGKAGEND